LGPLYAGFLGIINPIIHIIVLIPRSLSNYYLPEIVRNKRYGIQQKSIYNLFSRVNTVFLFLVFTLVVLSWVGYSFIFPDSELVMRFSFLVLVLMMGNILTSQMSLPLFTLLFAWDASKKSFMVNLIMFLGIIILLPLVTLVEGGIVGFTLIYVLLIVGNSGRFLFLKNNASKKF